MYLKTEMLYLYLETPLHAGAGSGLGTIDLPIQRERYTGIPIIQASGFKGALKKQRKPGYDKQELLDATFGPDKPDYAGSFGVGDARLLLYPVRSLKGVFAWITCSEVLNRWQRELALIPGMQPISLPNEPNSGQCFAGADVQAGSQVVLEEYCFTAVSGSLQNLATELQKAFPTVEVGAQKQNVYHYWSGKLPGSLVVLRSEDFCDLVQHTTEVLTRNRLDRNSKTVANQALWTEEHLPADSILFAPVRATPLRCPDQTKQNLNSLAPKLPDPTGAVEAANVLKWVKDGVPGVIQVGGDETVDRGLVRITWN